MGGGNGHKVIYQAYPSETPEFSGTTLVADGNWSGFAQTVAEEAGLEKNYGSTYLTAGTHTFRIVANSTKSQQLGVLHRY